YHDPMVSASLCVQRFPGMAESPVCWIRGICIDLWKFQSVDDRSCRSCGDGNRTMPELPAGFISGTNGALAKSPDGNRCNGSCYAGRSHRKRKTKINRE